MIVVSDTSPINYLILIELQDLLPKLFDRILIPEAVHRELHSYHPHMSDRRATIGSMAEARRAGRYVASSAMAARPADAAP